MPEKNNKKILIWLFPASAIKSNIVLNSIRENKDFYKKYESIFVFDGKGKNVDLAKTDSFKILSYLIKI